MDVQASGLNRKRRPTLRLYSGTRFPLGPPFGKRVPFFHGVLAMQSALALLLVRALKPKQPFLAVKAAGISVERTIGGNHAMARHDDRNRVASDRSPHGTRGHNGSLVSRYTMSSRNTLGDFTIRGDLATRDREQLKPNLTLKRRANQMQRRRKPRLLPRKISIQPSPGTLKHRRSRAICRTHRRHAASTRNRIGAFNMFGIFFEKRGAKVLLPLKPKSRQTAAISGKQDFAQRRSKRRRDHQRLLSKLRKYNTANCADNPNRPQSRPRQQVRSAAAAVTAPQSPQGGRREAPGPPPGLGPATATCPHISPAAPTNNGPIADRSQQRHRRQGPGLVFRTLRKPVWRLVRGSEGAGQGATHGRGRSEN